jgi:hypothetical protein
MVVKNICQHRLLKPGGFLSQPRTRPLPQAVLTPKIKLEERH